MIIRGEEAIICMDIKSVFIVFKLLFISDYLYVLIHLYICGFLEGGKKEEFGHNHKPSILM